VTKVVTLLLVAVSVGLDNFAASAALGVAGVDARLRFRVALIFGVFEGIMPIVGLLLGRSVAHALGAAADTVAGLLLGLTGAYALVAAARAGHRATERPALSVGRLMLMSVDGDEHGGPPTGAQ
jgi:putative Mn2+ efflux pump MntP